MRTPSRVFYELMVIPRYVLVVSRKLLGVEGEATNIETIAAGAVSIIGKRYQPEMSRHERIQRMEWDRREGQKIDRLSGAPSRILENTVPCRLRQHNAVT